MSTSFAAVDFLLQERISSPEALAAAAAAAAAAEAEANIAPVHEENDWGIEVVPDDAAAAADAAAASSSAGGGAGAAGEALPDGLQFSMPTAGVDEQVLQQEAVRPTDASLDELTKMLSSLNK
jgi:ubiquitin-like modifier-activating enzyme 5